MQTIPLEGDLAQRIVQALGRSPLFARLTPDVLLQVAQRGSVLSVEPGELIVREGAPSDSFFVVMTGELVVSHENAGGELVELVRLGPPESIGEMGLLLEQPRTATVVASQRTVLLRFDSQAFSVMYERVPGFGLGVSRALAARLQSSSKQLPMPTLDASVDVDPDLLHLLPLEFLQRHRALPVREENNALVLGFVDDVDARVLQAARDLLPGVELRPQRIPASLYDRALSASAAVTGWTTKTTPEPTAPPSSSPSSPKLDALLRRLVAEGGSDLHISGGQKPRWRIDGEMRELADVRPFSAVDVYELLEPVMAERSKTAFTDDNDADFAYAIDGLARFRVNLFRDKGGVGAVLRVIPAKILTFQQLNLPPVCQKLAELPKGLVLVTGPTGSGKSTTLAAMIDWINKNRGDHIITLEDPIEFVHPSLRCLINQREVGPHTKSFARALKAALREDPDIVLVGEMRDLETTALALETANTGHLVFGTLHTATAVSTIDRIIDLFPPIQQPQIRSVLADTLKGVVAQTLCKKIGGGRCAALETLVVSPAVANLIREGKNHMIASSMSTAKAQGNVMLNDALAQLVLDGRVDYAEALSHALDKADLAKRCNRPAPGDERAERLERAERAEREREKLERGERIDRPERPVRPERSST
jgi:twitching motility protein PilT